MATPLNIQNLSSALADGAFKKGLNAHNINYWNRSVITAIEMLTLIKKHRASGLECGEIAEKMNLNYATVNPFLSWLKAVKLVEAVIQANEKGQPVLYYPKAMTSSKSKQ